MKKKTKSNRLDSSKKTSLLFRMSLEDVKKENKILASLTICMSQGQHLPSYSLKSYSRDLLIDQITIIVPRVKINFQFPKKSRIGIILKNMETFSH